MLSKYWACQHLLCFGVLGFLGRPLFLFGREMDDTPISMSGSMSSDEAVTSLSFLG